MSENAAMTNNGNGKVIPDTIIQGVIYPSSTIYLSKCSTDHALRIETGFISVQ